MIKFNKMHFTPQNKTKQIKAINKSHHGHNVFFFFLNLVRVEFEIFNTEQVFANTLTN